MKSAGRVLFPKHLLIKLILQYLTYSPIWSTGGLRVRLCFALATHKVARRMMYRHVLFDQRVD